MSTLLANDPFGNPLQVQRPDSVAAVAGFIEGFLAYEPRILDVLPAAEHDDSLIVQTCAAVLWMFSESPAGPPKAREHLARARAAGLTATTPLPSRPEPLRHVGLYAYRADFLRRYPRLPVAPLETLESLEQLRVLWHGERIAVHVTPSDPGPGVDTPADLERVRRLFA